MTNDLNAPKCKNCGLRLIRFCPICQTPNSPLSEKCKKCHTPLLKKCKKCQAINPLSATHCKKCAAPLDEKPADFSPCSNLLVELANGSILEKQITNKEIAEKIIKKFFQAVLIVLKPYELKALKVAPYAIGVELDTIDDIKVTEIAQNILQEFAVLNEKLANAHLSYEIKVFVSQALSIKHRFGLDLLPKVQSGHICTDAPSAMSMKDTHDFEKIAPGIYALGQPIEHTISVEPAVAEPTQEILISPEQIEAQAQAEAELQAKQNSEPPKQEPATPEPTPEQHQAPKQEHQEASNKPSERQLAVKNLVNILSKKEGGLIALVGNPGIGKKTIFNLALQEVADKNFCLLQLDCHSSLNTVPFSSLQNLIRSMFSLPLINFEAEKNLTIVRNALSQSLGLISDDVVNPILNLLVPKAIERQDIEVAKQELIFALKELFKAISKMQKILLLIKEVEFLDKPSAEIFDALVEDGLLDDSFFVTTTSNNSHISALMSSDKLPHHNLGTIRLMPIPSDDITKELSYYITNPYDIPEPTLQQIKEKTQGWPLFIEEIIVFLGQAGFVAVDSQGVKVKPNISELVLPDSIDELIAVRLDSMFSQNEVMYQFMANAVCLGYSFFPPIIQKVLGLDDESFALIVQNLLNASLLITHDNVNFKFKSKFIYEIIKNLVIKSEEQERQINANLLRIVLDMNESNSSQSAQIALKAQDFQTAFTLWNLAVKEASSTGDKLLYLHAQKEALLSIDYSDYPDKEYYKLSIQEKLGSANYMTSPEDAIMFLSQAISAYENQNNREKVIELCAYIVKSLSMIGNTQEVMEYIDKSIEYLNPEQMPIEIALLKFIKLKFLVESGYLGEVVTIIQSDIMPALQKGIKEKQDFSDKEFEVIKEAIIKSQIVLIKALSLQGNKNYYNVLELFVNNSPDEASQIEIFAIDALHNVLNGMPDEAKVSIEKTENILSSSNIPNKEAILLELHLAKTLIKTLYEGQSITQDIPQLAQKSRKINNSFIYNFAQVLFVKQLYDNKDYANAANIDQESLNYFASQKIALFAIPCWVLLSKIQALVGGNNVDQAISIAQQALDVAVKPQIQNNYYTAYIKKLLADLFMLKDDFEMAKMHLEQAIEFAKTNDMLFFQGKFYLDLAKIHMQTIANAENKEEIKETATRLIDIAMDISASVESQLLQKQIEQAKAELGAL
jgi:ribosomal protein L40E